MRGRATHAHIPTAVMARYYAQRAQAGLIISEATGRGSHRRAPGAQRRSAGCADGNSEAVFVAAAAALDTLGIAFLELRAPRGASAKRQIVPALRGAFGGPLVLNQGYTLADASLAVASGQADAVAFGRPFIANPDLPVRLARGAELAFPDAKTFYSQGPAGYVDYPMLT